MPGRVLNFFEFSDKYSDSSATEKDLQDVTSAASNFADGFDDSTYDQPEIKPNRPVSGEYENTPNAPAGFNPEHSEEMNAPEGEETDSNEEYCDSCDRVKSKCVCASDENEEDDSEDEEEDDEEDKKEKVAQGNPEEANESKSFVKSFSSYINESNSRR